MKLQVERERAISAEPSPRQRHESPMKQRDVEEEKSTQETAMTQPDKQVETQPEVSVD